MYHPQAPADSVVSITLPIKAPASLIWQYITVPELIKRWMANAEITIEIETSWETGQPISFKGDLHGILFENKGTILQLESERLLKYSFWSSLSEQPDIPENYSLISFQLIPEATGTLLEFRQSNFIEETTYRHSLFYWSTALGIMKKMLES